MQYNLDGLMNGNNERVQELLSVIGVPVSDFQSPTGRGKLVKIDNEGCLFEAVKSEFSSNKGSNRIGETYRVPIYIAHNAYFF